MADRIRLDVRRAALFLVRRADLTYQLWLVDDLILMLHVLCIVIIDPVSCCVVELWPPISLFICLKGGLLHFRLLNCVKVLLRDHSEVFSFFLCLIGLFFIFCYKLPCMICQKDDVPLFCAILRPAYRSGGSGTRINC